MEIKGLLQATPQILDRFKQQLGKLTKETFTDSY